MILETKFYINAKETNLNESNILKGDTYIVIEGKELINVFVPKVETNIYKDVVPPLFNISAFNSLKLEIYKYNNNGFKLTKAYKLSEQYILLFEYKKEFIKFKFDIKDNLIVQRNYFKTKSPFFTVKDMDNKISKMKNNYYDFRLYKEISEDKPKKKDFSIFESVKSKLMKGCF